MKGENTRQIQTVDGWCYRARSGGDHELFVCMSDNLSITIRRQHFFLGYIDVGGLLASVYRSSVELGSMSETLPIRSFPAEVEWQPADAVIGKIVGEQNLDLGIMV